METKEVKLMNAVIDQITPETIQALIAQAAASGLSVDEYLKRLLGVSSAAPAAPEPGVDEFMLAMESLAEENIQPLPRDFSREDIYFPED
jgi:hypothetical protein